MEYVVWSESTIWPNIWTELNWHQSSRVKKWNVKRKKKRKQKLWRHKYIYHIVNIENQNSKKKKQKENVENDEEKELTDTQFIVKDFCGDILTFLNTHETRQLIATTKDRKKEICKKFTYRIARVRDELIEFYFVSSFILFFSFFYLEISWIYFHSVFIIIIIITVGIWCLLFAAVIFIGRR